MSFVEIQYSDLVDENVDLCDSMEKAFNKDGLGIIVISGVPHVKEVREALLPLAFKFANLDDEVKEKYVDEASTYSYGWSHGKEKFNGKLDVAKGSYYNNPVLDVATDDEDLKKKIPFFCRDNIWPKKDLPEMEKAFKDGGALLFKAACLLGQRIDILTKKRYPKRYSSERTVFDAVKNGKCHKGRLLYYFPFDEEKNFEKEPDSWCGWHLDNSSLTGLFKAMYVDGKTGKPVEMTDENAGLYIKDRLGKLHKGSWRPDQIAFQIGECSQILSAGEVMATPHCVQGSTKPGIGRCQFVSFFQPTWDYPLAPPNGVDWKECQIQGLPTDNLNFEKYSNWRFTQYYGKE